MSFGQSKEADEYYNKGIKLHESKQAHLAIPYFEKSDSLEKKELKKNSPDYYRSELMLAKCWDALANYYYGIKDTVETIRLQTLVVETRKKILGEKHPDYVEAQEKLDRYRSLLSTNLSADEYYNIGLSLNKTMQGHLALPYLEKCSELDKAQNKKSSPNYYRADLVIADIYKGWAIYFSRKNNYSGAVEHQTLVVQILKKVYGKKHSDYIDAKEDLDNYRLFLNPKADANDFYNKGREIIDYQPYNAIAYFQRSDSIEKATLEPSSEEYYRSELSIAECYWLLSNYYYKRRDYYEAANYRKQAVEIYKKVYGDVSDKYIDALQYLEYCYYLINKYDECIKIDKIILESIKKKYGEEHDSYISALGNLAYSYQKSGDNDEAFRLRNVALELTKKVYGEEHQKYIKQLDRLAMDYEIIDDYTEAIKLRNLATDLSKKVYGNESAEYASALNNLAFANSWIGNDTTAIRLSTTALEINKKIFGEEKSEYALSLSDIANFYVRAAYMGRGGSYAEAIRLQKKAVDILGKNAVEDEKQDTLFRWSSQYGGALRNLAMYYDLSGNYTEAVKYQTLCIEHENEYRGENAPDYEFKRLADYHLSAGEYDKGIEIYKNIYEAKISDMSRDFAFLSNEDRARKWNEGYSYSDFFNKDLPFAVYKSKNNEIAALAYNGAVLSKGFLLNSELEIQNIIEQKGNSVLVNRYYTIKKNQSMLDSLLSISADLRTINTDSLSKAIHDEEHQLISLTKELGDYVGNLSIDWKEIYKKLKDTDIAIEFVNFRLENENQQIYAALVLKNGMKYPELVKLFVLDEFYDIPYDEYYKSAKLYNIVWKPLEKYLQGVKNVYFSPAGLFHTIGIEYLPDENGNVFSEKYASYRLSSTRELALEHSVNQNKKAATYGGIKYDNSDKTGEKRGVATYLKGSKIESDTVAKLLQSADYEVIALSDIIATEESFKKLSGTNLKILHIGTHGFYYSQSDLEKAGFSFFSNNNQQSEEDKALSCSGLLFAGANFALDTDTRNAIPEGDDGILTAKEISRLDFKGLDLVVLSACQTGLGEVTGEGVFGLQRGFKKAGAQTIVMSLWEVDDYATRLLMTEFFKGLTSGKSKREAFLAASNYVKSKKSDPKYWAAFIMVDGLE